MERQAARILRGTLSLFTKGLPGASSMRVSLHRAQSHEELGRMVSSYLSSLESKAMIH